MKNQLHLFFVLAILFTFGFGCSSTIPTLEENPLCKTTLEGTFISDKILIKNTPNLFLKKNVGLVELRGKILKLDEHGVIFEKKGSGVFGSSEILEFPLDTVYCAVDSLGKVIYGEVPKIFTKNFKLFVELEDLNDPSTEFLFLEFIPNEPFAYCMPPGHYRIKRIEFQIENGEKHVGSDFKDIRLAIEPNKANYIGDFYYNKNINSEYEIIIPTKRYSNSAAAGAFFLGGMVGSAIHEIGFETSDIDNYHRLSFVFDNYFLSEANLPIIRCKLRSYNFNFD